MKTPLLDQLDLERLSPMMKQYVALKRQQADCLLFFRLGDFYELFFDDALIAAQVLEIALTARDCGQAERAPMCGVPYHAVDTYLNRLVQAGYKVAICEQVEDPALAKGIVSRDIVRIVTPGTRQAEEGLEGSRNNYLASLQVVGDLAGLAWVDVTTYELSVTYSISGHPKKQLLDELLRLQASEVLVETGDAHTDFIQQLRQEGICVSPFSPDQGGETGSDYTRFYPQDRSQQVLWQPALDRLLAYLDLTQRGLPARLQPAEILYPKQFLYLSATARRTLELTENQRARTKKGSLLGLLDLTQTAMGGRFLKRLVEQPLLHAPEIEQRLTAVDELYQNFILRQELRSLLKGFCDLERLSTKVLMGQVTPRALGQLRESLRRLPAFLDLVQTLSSPLIQTLFSACNAFESLQELLERALVDSPPILIQEGGIIAEGYDETCDQLRSATIKGKDWILGLEQQERDQTGIKGLKIGYNRVFGYFLEVTKSQQDRVPEAWIRKQTLTNAERYVTPELKALEEQVTGAHQKLLQLEQQLFLALREQVAGYGEALLEMSRSMAYFDALLSLAEVAERHRFVRPTLSEGLGLSIEGGRHPVVEANLDAGAFVPNDLQLDGDQKTLMILTGPNMAGKSTYMRQAALIVLMAQMGSFVPATSATVGLVDAIFTRIGASDDLSSGQSTFMVEMQEVADILERATPRSLLLLDEIGRGTSTYDGLAIASAVIESLCPPQGLGARTLFATHYHELIELEQAHSNILNAHVAVKRQGQEIVFLHHIVPGGSDDSFGIEVAQLAGVPRAVVEAARETLSILETNHAGQTKLKFRKRDPMQGQLSILGMSPSQQETLERSTKAYQSFLNELLRVPVNHLSPIEALNQLHTLQEQAKQLRKEV